MSLHPLVGSGTTAIRLHPGDVLLFTGRSPLSLAIRTKTWSRFSHAELYVGQAREVPTLIAEGWAADTPVVVTAKRRSVTMKGWRKVFGGTPPVGDGVDFYPFDASGLALVCRPQHSWQRQPALTRFCAEMRHQHYGTLDLLVSFYACRRGRTNDSAFCSETVTRVLRWGGVEPFADRIDADIVAPSLFEYSLELHSLDPWGVSEDAA